MKTRTLLIVAGSALLFAACIPSVYPFYTAKDLVFDNRLLGEWHEKGKTNDAQIWNFDKAETNTYKLKVTEEQGKTGEFSAHLFKLNDDYFLDLVPTDCDYASDQASLVNAAMFPGHLLAHVVQFEPDLKLAFFNFDWLQKYLEEKPDALAHYKEKDRLLLTASSADLQRFVLKHLNEIFSEAGDLTRKTD
jgi:hypothetical protein